MIQYKYHRAVSLDDAVKVCLRNTAARPVSSPGGRIS